MTVSDVTHPDRVDFPMATKHVEPGQTKVDGKTRCQEGIERSLRVLLLETGFSEVMRIWSIPAS